MIRLKFSLFLLIILTVDLSAQYGQWEIATDLRGDRFSNYYGPSCAALGDQNGDGINDVIIGDPNFAVAAGSAGRIQILSGKDGSLIRQNLGYAVGSDFGRDVSSAGDCTGDGIDDYLVYAERDDYGGLLPPGAVYLFSGTNGQLIRIIRQANLNSYGFGNSMAPFRDFDGDGMDDFLIGSSFETLVYPQDGAVRVYSGATGAILLEFSGGFDEAFLGGRVASGGDFDGDGVVDILSGSEGASIPGGIRRSGAARVFSGVDGHELMRIGGDQQQGNFGSDIDFLGDINGDGKDEFIVGADGGGTGFNTGTVEVFRGGDGELLFKHEHLRRNASLGLSVAGLGDVDGDGIPDYAGGAWGVTGIAFASGEVLVFSGADGFPIGRIKGVNYYSSLGWDVAGIGDVNGDGRADVLSVEPGFLSPGASAGRARIDSLDPFIYLSTNTLQASSPLAQSLSVNLDFPVAFAGHPYQIIAATQRTVGLRRNPLDLPMDDGALLRQTVSGDYGGFPFSSGMTGIINAQGHGDAVLLFPPFSPALAPGSAIYFAAVTFGSSGTLDGVTQSLIVQID